MSNDEVLLSKRQFLAGLQCKKWLWHAVNDEAAIPGPDASRLAMLKQSRDVGRLAQQLFPGAIEVNPGTPGLDEAVRRTKEAMETGQPLCGATFAAAGGCCRVDMLNPCPGGQWELVGVKSSTSVKPEHLEEMAFQEYVLRKAGVAVGRTRLMTINADFVKSGEIDPNAFFVDTDVSVEVLPLRQTVGQRLAEMVTAAQLPGTPQVSIGPQCDEPCACPLRAACWAFLPDGNVLELFRGRKKGFSLLNRDIVSIQDIGPGEDLTVPQNIQRLVASTGVPFVEEKAIIAFLNRLEYPVHYLDFETFATAVPLFDGTKPYQQVPFQFSLHRVRAPGAGPEHTGFLAEGREDPRPEFMRHLRQALEPAGSVVAYNAAFELTRLWECCDVLPQFSPWVEVLESRCVDLLEPFTNFDCYHPGQRGSVSMKSVLPALTGRGYGDLAIQKGVDAGREFMRVTFGEVDDAERLRVRKHLEEYCGLDTEGMIWIVQALSRLSSGM